MKLVKLSLAMMIAMGTSAFGADSLADAFKNGKVNGEFRAFYWDRKYGTGAAGPAGAASTDNDILTLGVRLGYETDELNGFKVGLGFQGQSNPWASEEAKMDHQLPFDMGASGAILSEAYLSYALNKTVIKVGRQYFDKPLMGSDQRDVTIQAIEGVTIVSEDVPDTTLYGAYAWRMQWMKDNAINNEYAEFGKFGLLKPEDDQGDFAWVVGAINKSLPDTELTLAYGEVDRSHSLLLAQADYTPMIQDDIKLLTGLQYWNTNIDEYSAAWADSTVYSGKLGAEFGPLGAYVAYTQIEDGRSAWGLGMLNDRPRLYTSTLTDAGQYEASTQYAADLHYFVAPISTVFGLRYVNIDLDEEGAASSLVGTGEIDQTGIYAIGNMDKYVKGLTLMLFYEQADNSNEAFSRDEFRLRVHYVF